MPQKSRGNRGGVMRLMPSIVLCLIVLFQIGCSKKSDDQGMTPTLREEGLTVASESCSTFVKRLQSEFATVPGAFYDFILAPENPGDPTGKQIKIFYYGRMVKGSTPVVFFNGGPAGNSHSSYTILNKQQKLDE